MADVVKKARKDTSPPLYETLDKVYLGSVGNAVERLGFCLDSLILIYKCIYKKIFLMQRGVKFTSGF